jgi:hypothetical protein
MLLYKSAFAEDPRSTQCAKTQLQSPKHNPNESNVRLSASLAVVPSVVLLSVASHWFPSVSTPCSLANYKAGTRQHPCIIWGVCHEWPRFYFLHNTLKQCNINAQHLGLILRFPMTSIYTTGSN